VAVHESRASWDAFLESVFLPQMSAGIDGGFTTPPVETEWEVTHFYN
jgi:hypothetical protein